MIKLSNNFDILPKGRLSFELLDRFKFYQLIKSITSLVLYYLVSFKLWNNHLFRHFTKKEKKKRRNGTKAIINQKRIAY